MCEVIHFPVDRTRPPATAYDLIRFLCRDPCMVALEWGAECCRSCEDKDSTPEDAA